MFSACVLDIPAVILDNGSGLCKAGLSGDNAPRSVVMSVVGHPKNNFTMLGAEMKDYYIGEEAKTLRGILMMEYPIEHGVVKCWSDMEKIWKHMYDCELRINAKERPVLLSEAPLNPHRNRETMAEVMFENFGVPAMHVALQAPLSLYANGCTTGLVVDIGDGVTHTFPIYEGIQLPHSGNRLNAAGRDITEYFSRLLRENGLSFVSSSEKDIAKEIKEKLCYVALDPCEEMRRDPEEILYEYTLPDGKVIAVGDQLFRAPEALFSPCDIGIDASGLHTMIYNSIVRCDIDFRKVLYGSVLLSGGSTLFPGLDARIYKEMTALVPGGVKVNIIAPKGRQYAVWIGGSVLTCLKSFREMWVTSIDYNEFGPSIVHQKCS